MEDLTLCFAVAAMVQLFSTSQNSLAASVGGSPAVRAAEPARAPAVESDNKGGSATVDAQSKQGVPVHDPVMIRQGHTFYLFATGPGIAVWSSQDMRNWKREQPVFPRPPAWALAAVPGFKGYIWAPDISYHDGTYYLYYSVSVFGKNTSCIGVALNETLDPSDPRFKWVDRGKVVQSFPGLHNWNAIDPNLVTDGAGTPYLAFGSFWGGLQLVRLRPDRLAPAEDPADFITVASRLTLARSEKPFPGEGYPVDAGDNAIEAPFIFKHGGHYYLFASIDYCCRGTNSNYKMMVGRADSVAGPYVDKAGAPLAHGGGTLLLAGDAKWHGVGHNAVCTFDGVDYLIFHGYDAADRGRSKLRIEPIVWDADGWPVVANSTSAKPPATRYTVPQK